MTDIFLTKGGFIDAHHSTMFFEKSYFLKMNFYHTLFSNKKSKILSIRCFSDSNIFFLEFRPNRDQTFPPIWNTDPNIAIPGLDDPKSGETVSDSVWGILGTAIGLIDPSSPRSRNSCIRFKCNSDFLWRAQVVLNLDRTIFFIRNLEQTVKTT